MFFSALFNLFFSDLEEEREEKEKEKERSRTELKSNNPKLKGGEKRESSQEGQLKWSWMGPRRTFECTLKALG